MNFRSYLPYYKRNLQIAGPIMLSQLGGAVTQLADNIMVGRLGTVELAAASFANAIFSVGFLLAFGISMAITPLVGRHYVRSEHEVVAGYLQNSLVAILLATLVISVILACLCPLFGYMGQSPEVVELAAPYYLLLVVSLLPFMLYAYLKQFLEGLGNTNVAMVITIIANVVNVLFNYFWIFGNCGFTKLGVVGAGAATLLSRVIMPLMFIPVLARRHEWMRYIKMFSRSRFSLRTAGEVFRVGLPISGQMSIEMGAFSLSTIMVGWMGAVSLAAHQITISMSMMTFMAVIGIGNATTIRVSHQYGLRDYKSLRMAANASIHLSLVINTLLGLLVIIFRREIPMAYSTDPEVVELASHLMFWLGCYQVVDSLQGVGLGILRGMTDVLVPMIAAFVAYGLICLPTGYALGIKAGLGAEGVWIAFTIGLAFASLFYHWRIRRKFRSFETAEA